MKISVISRWHDAADFAPFFLGHYSWADEIIIMLDKSTADNSAEIIGRYSNARFEYFDHGGVINDRLLAEMMSDLAATLKGDWIIYADADEFVFPCDYADGITVADPRMVLDLANGNLIETWFWWVYRHKTDTDLDPTKPAIWQRRHGGEYTIVPGMGERFMKPCIVKPETRIRWGIGTHNYQPSSLIKVSSTKFAGVHWQMADVEMAVKRNASSKGRLSAENIRNGWGVKNFTEEMIRAECKAHENDSWIF
jgi:hypothetical protein